MHAQRFCDNNTATLASVNALTHCPQPPHCIPRRSGEPLSYVAVENDDLATRTFTQSGLVYVAYVGANPWLEDVKRLWVDTNDGNGLQLFYRSTDAAVASATAVDGEWSFQVASSFLLIHSKLGNPTSQGWTIIRDADVAVHADHHSTRNLQRHRWISHPALGEFEYPSPPNRTVNYWRSAIRGYDVQASKTLRGSVTTRDIQQWEDIVITEVWEGGGDRVSMLAEFFDALHLVMITEPAIGRYVGWAPQDLSYQRHMILPLAITVGSSKGGVDIKEWRARQNTAVDSYIDNQVNFSFRLIRPARLVDSFLIAGGW